MRFQDAVSRAKDAFRLGLGIRLKDYLDIPNTVKGEVFIEMRDAKSGVLLYSDHRKNIITLDASIQVARLLKDPSEPAHGINMLAVGTGATGPLLSPNAPDNRQRKLNAEIARKPFTSTTFRDALGNAVAYPTNIVDYACTFGEAEAVGPLNEMSLLSTISDNPSVRNPNPNTFPTRDVTVDLTEYDVACNYLTFAVVSKPSTAVLTIVWRLTH
jgi:hypothetical protein